MQKIRCVVERITYQNPENGYSVLKCRVKDYSDLVPVIGNLLDANVGSVLLVDGNWKVDAKYGKQFVAENWEETLPATIYGMEKYLGSGLIKGVGPKFANYYHVEPSQIQVLTPMQRGVVGATNLNLALQETLNPADEEIFMRGRGKVMMPKS